MGRLPHWAGTLYLNSDPLLRDVYPAVPPWEWAARPVWRDRLLAHERGLLLAKQMLAEQAAADSADTADRGNV